MQLSNRTLNRTLWVRQQLVPSHAAGVSDPVAMVAHLVGLQAQDNLPPYLSLAARMPGFDPLSLSDALEQRRLVRILSMRGTVHVLTPDDAVTLRPWVQPALDAVSRSNAQSRAARDVPSAKLDEAATAALEGGPLTNAELADRLGRVFPDVPAASLRNAARERVPLVQVPPRGLWMRSGGVVYELVTTWLQRPLDAVDLPDLVRRYLRAYGPASAADMTKWSSVTGLAPVFRAMDDELVEHTTEAGKTVWDVPDGVLVDGDLDLAPVLLGNYDNIWLSHADRSRIATDANRTRWLGANGGTGAGVFVDGMLEGVWRRDGDSLSISAFREFTRHEQAGVDTEIDRIRTLLRR
ncbi:MAG: winged helix DNA-binding domain-containing protein [Jatrophihabitans sp.]